jgi:hypothetical protein
VKKLKRRRHGLIHGLARGGYTSTGAEAKFNTAPHRPQLGTPGIFSNLQLLHCMLF